MTDPISAPGVLPSDTPLLYSQTPTDERGNFAYKGDLMQSNETFAVLCARMIGHLRDFYPDL